ncbi:MAG: hypothetical protein J6W64_07825 [Bacilli bacterium]|nr:hypothetical protein [Bacilli bacterium]
MYSIYKKNDNISAYVSEFVCDTVADIATLPTDKRSVYPGSTCLVAATSEVYVLNASFQWVKLG